MQSKYTKGPWVANWPAGFVSTSVQHFDICMCYSRARIPQRIDGVPAAEYEEYRKRIFAEDHEEAKANARLIAAAPELAEALYDALLIMTSQRVRLEEQADAITKARAALAKAGITEAEA
jgi:hypothetical protein